MKSPILSPAFRWIAASTHTDPELFRQRQLARIAAAQKVRFVPIKPKAKDAK